MDEEETKGAVSNRNKQYLLEVPMASGRSNKKSSPSPRNRVPGKMNKMSKLPSADIVAEKVNKPAPPKLVKMGKSATN